MPPLVIATFTGVLIIVLGGYWAFVLRTEQQSTSQLKKRLKRTFGIAASGRPSLAKGETQLSSVGVLHRVLLRVTAISSPASRLIEQADVRTSVGALLLMSGTAALAAYSIVAFLTHLRGLGILVGVLFGSGPFLFLSWKRSRRLLRFEELFPEAIDLIARALRAGHAFTTGISMVAEEIPDPVGVEFKLLYDRQNFGMPLPEALRSFAERVPLLDARFFATAVLTQREAGGNLSEVLENLARVVRERFKVKRQIQVISAHARMTGFVLVGLPPVTALGMLIISPENAKLLITDPIGIKMVIAAVVLQLIGGYTIKRLVNVEY